jgi:hypothetical protein
MIDLDACIQAVAFSRVRHSMGPGPCYIPGEAEAIRANAQSFREILADPIRRRRWCEQQIEFGRTLGMTEDELPTVDAMEKGWTPSFLPARCMS